MSVIAFPGSVLFFYACMYYAGRTKLTNYE